MTYKEYQDTLNNMLSSLSSDRLAVFSLCCFERIYGLYPLYSEKFNIKDKTIENIAQFLWNEVSKPSHKDIEDKLHVIEEALPSDDFTSWESSICINTCICLDTAARTLIGENREGQVAAEYVYDTICQVIYSIIPDKYLSKELLSRIFHSQIMKEEIQLQFNLINFLKNSKVLDILVIKQQHCSISYTKDYIYNSWYNEKGLLN